jgi:two-component system response regulator GlrR
MNEVLDVRPRERGSTSGDFARFNLLGTSPAFLAVLRIIERAAAVDAPAFIQGETGTGKELAARALHYLGSRRDFPFIPINCGALPDSLLESELFGHTRGAFTDAKQANSGLVAQAEGGTLYFDEVEAMTPRAQVVLLRFLQDQKYRAVGGHVVANSNVRIIASSNVDLEEMVRRKEFRADLLFRFRILSITMPPLRKRGNDVVLLAEHFLRSFATRYSRPIKQLHPDMVAWMLSHPWPGNVRKLENMILREFLLGDGGVVTIPESDPDICDLQAEDPIQHDRTFMSAKAQALAVFERVYLDNLLTRTGGNISLAARISGKERSALSKLVRKHGLIGERYRVSST